MSPPPAGENPRLDSFSDRTAGVRTCGVYAARQIVHIEHRARPLPEPEHVCSPEFEHPDEVEPVHHFEKATLALAFHSLSVRQGAARINSPADTSQKPVVLRLN
jgi:hypothetical protein